jgi:hypothetical protein
MRSSNLNLKAQHSLRFQAIPNRNDRINTVDPQALISIRQAFIRSENAKDTISEFLESTIYAGK